MRKHIQHPVTRHRSDDTELHLLHGGDERAAIEESLVIARDLRDVLRDGENILHVNMLVSARRLEHIMGKRFDHGARRGRNYFVTYLAERFIDKLPAIRGIVDARGIRYLVLTGFELAALSSRHRAEFMAWIRMMRNAGVNVILFTMSCPGRYGALGALRYSARTINEVGAYLKQTEDTSIDQVDEEPIEEASAQEHMPANASEETAHESTFADMPNISRIIKGTGITNTDPDTDDPEHSDTDPLKTKDLEVEMV